MRSCFNCLCLVLLLCLNFIDASVFRCDYKYNANARGWFKHVAEPASWYDARKKCADEGAVLASPTGNDKDDGIAYILNATTSDKNYIIFTGIHATAKNRSFRDAEGTHYPDFRDWEPNHADNMELKDICVIMKNYGNGSLNLVPCKEKFPYICYYPANKQAIVSECGTEDPEYHLDSRTNKCYKYHDVARSFSRAVAKCAVEGGHLAIINSDTEAQVLSEIFTEHPLETMKNTRWREIVFIGIYNYDKKKDWRTIHGQALKEAGYARFSPGEPNNAGRGQHCGAIYRNGLINDVYCNEPAVFICEKGPELDFACSLPDKNTEGYYTPKM